MNRAGVVRISNKVMASEKLKDFLRKVDEDEDYSPYAELLHVGKFTTKAQLGAASREQLIAIGIPDGAAGLIIQAAKGAGEPLH